MNHTDIEKPAETLAAMRTCFLLQSGLFSLLQETPFEKITLTELCRRSMVPRSTFYRYFDDKYDLLYYCMRTFLDQLGLDEEVIYLKNDASLQDFIGEIIRVMDSQKAAFLRIWQTNRNGIFMDMLRNCLIQILKEHLKESDARGLKSKIPYPIFTCLLVDFYISVAKCYLETSGQFTAEQFISYIAIFSGKDFFQ